jgi:hypothetical protein
MLEWMKNASIRKAVALTLQVLSHPQVEKRVYDILHHGLIRNLKDKDTRNLMWLVNHFRPPVPETHWAVHPNSVEEERYRLATMETACYVTEKLSAAPSFALSFHLLNFCMDRLDMEGDILEFGVFEGLTINHIAGQTTAPVHGFDSFRGLPEHWATSPAGTFDARGTPPEVRPNVELHIGTFDQTLPAFVQAHPGPVAFLHIDCDLYSSTRTVLFGLQEKLVPGTMIVFDEYFNYPTWQQHEFRAFQEFVAETGTRYEYIGYTDKGFSAAVRVV